jgi:hypothetical protein
MTTAEVPPLSEMVQASKKVAVAPQPEAPRHRFDRTHFGLTEKEEEGKKLQAADPGAGFSPHDIEVWDYIMTHRRNMINTSTGNSISWLKFQYEWKRAAVIANLLEKNCAIPSRTRDQLKDRHKYLKVKV